MARTWISIRVELISGGGETFWPRPGRVFAAARSHSFAELAAGIDTAFARWDLAHLHQFLLADGVRLGRPDWDTEAEGLLDDRRSRLSRLSPGEQFVYEFDFGDSWTHLCTVGEHRIDPAEHVPFLTAAPQPYWGWGALPDQYGRRWDSDDGEDQPPLRPDPDFTDLPPLLPWWGLHTA